MVAGTWNAPKYTLQEMRISVEQKLRELSGEKERAAFTAYVFLVAASTPKQYKEIMDRYLVRTPGTKYSHELHVIHQSICEWVQPERQRRVGEKAKSVKTSIFISDSTNQRHSYFVQLLQEQGVQHPVPELVQEFATAWIYAKIDEAIEQEK